MRKGNNKRRIRGKVHQRRAVMTPCLGMRCRYRYIVYNKKEVREREMMERTRIIKTSESIRGTVAYLAFEAIAESG